MKTFIITMVNNQRSVDAANQCLESCKKFGYDAEIFEAITPDDGPYGILEKEGLPKENILLEKSCSKLRPALCCFLSHYFLWKRAIELNETILCLEHDAIMVNKLAPRLKHSGVCNLGKPSYGYFIKAKKAGTYYLFSKPNNHFPGTHAVLVSPEGAKKLIKQAKVRVGALDLFLNKTDFPWLSEYYPWPVECDDSFTTIQNERGCLAKHNYEKGTFDIL
jgi:GR25 family glycosyltransferase involved in LPS biosynthesis